VKIKYLNNITPGGALCIAAGKHRGAAMILMIPAARLLFQALFFGVAASAAMAQHHLSFEVQNGLTLEQISVAKTQRSISSSDRPSLGSASLIAQTGSRNSAFTATIASPGAATTTLQAGSANLANAVIQESPRSVIAQLQVGEGNTSQVGIIGGRDNAVATAQIGNNLGINFGLINSKGTRVVYGQAGSNYSGGIVVRNAPPGTVITLN